MFRSVLSFALLLSLGSYSFGITQAVSGLEANFSDTEREIYLLINRERVRQKLGMLIWDDHLAMIARGYSAQMASENFFDHIDPAGNGVEHRAFRANLVNWRKIGENLFYIRDVTEFSPIAVRMWMESATHRQNVLDRGWTSTGIGIAKAADGRIFVTQVFMTDQRY
jgi:uncharacterized protein YkwD